MEKPNTKSVGHDKKSFLKFVNDLHDIKSLHEKEIFYNIVNELFIMKDEIEKLKNIIKKD